MIKVSVIIPTYGIPVYLEKAIQSVLSQTLSEFELIIVDDNDPRTEARKKTESIVEKYIHADSRVKYLRHEHNMNGAVARNTGFSVAKGKYISLLDSDDEYKASRLQACYDAMESAPFSVAGVYTGCEFRRHGKVYHVEKKVPSGNFLVKTLACTFMFCTGSNVFVRKSVVDQLDGFDGNFLRHQDYEFLVRLFEKYSLIGLSEILVIKNNENTNMPNLEKQEAIKKQYLSKFAYILDMLPQQDVNYIKHCNYIKLAECAVARCNFKSANRYYSEAAKYGGLTFSEYLRRILLPIYNKFRR